VNELDELVRELEDTALRLRSGELGADEAAALIDRCAALALQVGSGLDRLGRDAEREDPGQEQLL
jgi:hypothetical protein